MADLDRGAYTPPTDGGLSFDPRDTRRRRPLPITLILSVVILLILVAAMLFLYRAGTRTADGEPQPVGDPVGEVREPPPAEAQPVDPASGLDVYTDEGAEPGAPVFTPAPEAPIARTAPAPAPVAPSAPAVTGTTGTADPEPARAAAPAQPRPTPAPLPTRPAPAAPTPAPARPAPAPAPTRPTTPAPTPAPAPARPAPEPAAPPAAARVGPVSAQIGAFNTRAQAQAALARQPGGAGQRIEEVQRNGQTLYRAIATGFPDRAAAQAYCAGVSGGCIIR